MFQVDMSLSINGGHAELAQHAKSILIAWGCGDRARLQQEIDSTFFRSQFEDGNSERYELLFAIASRMIACDRPAAKVDADPQVGVCLGLLSHLICEPEMRD